MIKIKTPITVVIVSIFLSYSCENASNNRMSNASRKDVNELMEDFDLSIEEEVISAVLAYNFQRKPNDTTYNKRGKIISIERFEKPELVLLNSTLKDIMDTTYLSNLGFNGLDSDMIEDYRTRNDTTFYIQNICVPEADVLLVDLNDIESNDIRAKTKLYFSYPGFNSNRTRAVVMLMTYSDPLTSSEEYYILEYINGKWMIENRVLTMIS